MSAKHLLLAGGLMVLSALSARAQSWRFDFGAGPVADGWIGITPDMLYDAARGYGFDVMPTRATRNSDPDPITTDFVTSDAPFKFSVRLAEGNYRVTVILGDTRGTSCTTVKAEERRLMLERVRTPEGGTVRLDFGVNVRHNTLSKGNAIKFDVREWDPATDLPVTNTWDDRLTLTFSDELPCVCAVKIAPMDDALTVFLLGDSTVTDQVTEPYGTWGQHLTRWLQLPVVVANHAESGQTAKGFRFQRRWDKVMELIKPGDYVFIQFGHNDLNARGHDAMWPLDDQAGEWVRTHSDALTDYKWELAGHRVSDDQDRHPHRRAQHRRARGLPAGRPRGRRTGGMRLHRPQRDERQTRRGPRTGSSPQGLRGRAPHQHLRRLPARPLHRGGHPRSEAAARGAPAPGRGVRPHPPLAAAGCIRHPGGSAREGAGSAGMAAPLRAFLYSGCTKGILATILWIGAGLPSGASIGWWASDGKRITYWPGFSTTGVKSVAVRE